MSDRNPNRFRPQLQPLEGRDQPGTLLVSPPGFIDPNVGFAVPDNAKPGLGAAETHTHGVIVWNPSPGADGIDRVGTDVAGIDHVGSGVFAGIDHVGTGVVDGIDHVGSG